jgi:hypothetical protein
MKNSKLSWDKSAPSRLLKFPNKELRTHAIADYVKQGGFAGVVIFTCGNAARELREKINPPAYPTRYTFVEVGPKGDLNTDKWWTPAQIARAWPNLFDATSGHLPFPLMVQIADTFRDYFEGHPELVADCDQFYVPTGSGETILCLSLAFPEKKFCAVYDNSKPATTRDNDAPLNEVIDNIFPVEYWHGSLAI